MKTSNSLLNKFFSVAFFFFLLVNFSFAQQRWERAYGGPGWEFGYSVQQTTDMGYVVAGFTNSFGNGYQVYLIKTDTLGDTLWTRTYGGALDDEGYSVQQTTDLGYVVAGCTNSLGNGYQVYLIKTDTLGDTLWTRTYGGALDDEGYSVWQTTDLGYIVAGVTNSFGNGNEIYLVRTDSTGDPLWTKTYGGRADDVGHSVQETSDGGFIVVGALGDTISIDSTRMYLFKTNASGDTLWSLTYRRGWTENMGYSVQQTWDTGYIASGSYMAGTIEPRWYTIRIKTDAFGDTLWIRCSMGNSGDAVRQTSDNGYIIAGSANYGIGGTYKASIMKANASGDEIWHKDYGSISAISEGRSVQQTTDMGYVVAGCTNGFGNGYQVYLIKTDANGNIGVEEEADGRCTNYDARLRIHPNPFEKHTTVSFSIQQGARSIGLKIYDASGRTVRRFDFETMGQSGQIIWDGRDDHGVQVPAGVYFIRAEDQRAAPVRVVKIR